MAVPKLSKLEFQIMETLWVRGEASIREVLDSLPAKGKTGVQHHPNHDLQDETKGRCAAREEGGQFSRLRGSHNAGRGAAAGDR